MENVERQTLQTLLPLLLPYLSPIDYHQALQPSCNLISSLLGGHFPSHNMFPTLLEGCLHSCNPILET
jgi:hypothetical protein